VLHLRGDDYEARRYKEDLTDVSAEKLAEKLAES
jgi:hypothetical protein